MSLLQHFKTLAVYNDWANRRLYDACAELSEDAYLAERPAFFKSIHGTLNHILIGDRMWIGRIVGVDSGLKRLDEVLYPNIEALRAAREAEDQRIDEVVNGLSETDLQQDYSYKTVSFGAMTSPLWHMLGHLFNHQTHHRGQVHDQLTQTTVAPPPLDLMYYLREAA